MPTSPNTPGTAAAILALCKTATVSNLPAYANSVAGEFKDITDLVPTLEVYGADDDTDVVTMLQQGGTAEVFDDQNFWIVTTVPMTDETAGWQSLWAIRDAVTEILNSTTSIAEAGITFVGIEKGSGKYEPVYRNDVWWLMHRIKLMARYEYTVTRTA